MAFISEIWKFLYDSDMILDLNVMLLDCAGLVAQQQCVGPLQLPVADVAVMAQSHLGLTGPFVYLWCSQRDRSLIPIRRVIKDVVDRDIFSDLTL